MDRSESPKKIALFGGTFNPIHLAHLRCAEEIREAFGFEKLIFVPAHIPPHKKAELVESKHRLKMVELAIEGNPYFDISDIELKRGGKSYSIDTVRHFSSLLEDKKGLYLIMGLAALFILYVITQYPCYRLLRKAKFKQFMAKLWQMTF